MSLEQRFEFYHDMAVLAYSRPTEHTKGLKNACLGDVGLECDGEDKHTNWGNHASSLNAPVAANNWALKMGVHVLGNTQRWPRGHHLRQC